EKGQGTKSRVVGTQRCRNDYGDLGTMLLELGKSRGDPTGAQESAEGNSRRFIKPLPSEPARLQSVWRASSPDLPGRRRIGSRQPDIRYALPVPASLCC